ncbi:PREDICTED: G-type lectin S-receptor-like serine/threonine-protein kinase At1g67520 isoform X1 [Prunus mume]|uniref:Receptor-like serine/threonine-protein kinase n=1 Tax=Prunus mume TaxID=102107 RepID=A0ABM1LMB7_PRUMU|nr:PREDICTED: G-type lectin S-receptor-like serine/threonine-protein kinase At1g67520 isoform X1 [Prunus mume]XP_016648544.1 PREDICTED: G-type lectin S-receptor-like serine/threonine-protein kinase At1g67520 isoform X1 [Prunus mume]
MARTSSACLSVASFLFFSSLLWNFNAARDTLKPGDTLNSSSSLVSGMGKFTMGFHIYDHNLNYSYLVVKWAASHNYAWIANRNKPILYPLGILTLDQNNTLKITHKDGEPVVLYSASETSNANNIVATLLDSGNFVLQELSFDGSPNRVLWQSFDFPVDVLLPGMKLGLNHKSGHVWSLSSWFTPNSAVPGAFTLDWDPEAHELKIRRRGVVYWSSGAFRNGRFKFILPDESKLRYNFSIVSNEDEDYFTYSAVDQSGISEWVLTIMGRLYDFDETIDIAQADYCYGSNTDGGCQMWDRPIDCRHAGDRFEEEKGYFNPTRSGPTATSDTSNTSFSISDCKAACWKNCDCLGFNYLFDNQTGCRFWTGHWEFIKDSTGYSSSNIYFLTTKASSNHEHKRIIWIGTAAAAALLTMVLSIMCCLLRRRIFLLPGENRRKIDDKELLDVKESYSSNNVNALQNDGDMGHDLRVFSYASVKAATENFCDENKLGEGGFGPVYKGKMSTGQEIAVKRLSRCSLQGTWEFKNELILISELQHTNLVRILGFCIHGVERMLIYEYMPNKSLDCFLFDSTRGMLLDWKKRFNIIEGIAQGLLYLHKYSRLRVIHRDLKASNILLDEDMNPKISDFGMARIFTHNEREANTNRIVGTYGYMSPEYAMGGIFSTKSDVYSFGVLTLEIISGRKNNSFYNADRVLNIVGYAWGLWNEGAGLRLMDPTLHESCIEDQLIRCIHVGLLCVEEDAADRPTMSEVISMLTNESMSLPIPTRPAFFTIRNEVDADMSVKESEVLSRNDFSRTDIVGR